MSDKILNQRQLGLWTVDHETYHKLSPNYLAIHKKVVKMSDTFGLCSILSTHTGCLLQEFPSWEKITYNPKQYKDIFDNLARNGANKSAVHLFWEKHHHIVTPKIKQFKIRTIKSFRTVLKVAESQNYNLRIAFLCQYDKYEGVHTHWVACKRGKSARKVTLSGDLTPFGINAPIIEVDERSLINALKRVINHPITTNLSGFLKQSDQSITNSPVFKYNAAFDATSRQY